MYIPYCPSCKTKKEVINHLALDECYYKNIKEKSKKLYYEDLAQDILLDLLNRTEQKILELNQKNELFKYINRIIWAQIKSWNRRDSLVWKYESHQLELDVHLMAQQPEEKEEDLTYITDQIKEAITTPNLLHWYEEKIFNLKVDTQMSYRQMEEILGIPRQSLCRTFNIAKDKIKKQIKF